jgi:hypothetical protein
MTNQQETQTPKLLYSFALAHTILEAERFICTLIYSAQVQKLIFATYLQGAAT